MRYCDEAIRASGRVTGGARRDGQLLVRQAGASRHSSPGARSSHSVDNQQGYVNLSRAHFDLGQTKTLSDGVSEHSSHPTAASTRIWHDLVLPRTLCRAVEAVQKAVALRPSDASSGESGSTTCGSRRVVSKRNDVLDMHRSRSGGWCVIRAGQRTGCSSPDGSRIGTTQRSAGHLGARLAICPGRHRLPARAGVISHQIGNAPGPGHLGDA